MGYSIILSVVLCDTRKHSYFKAYGAWLCNSLPFSGLSYPPTKSWKKRDSAQASLPYTWCVDNLGFYLGAKYLHLIKPRRKKAYYFGGLRSREELDFASYNYSDFKALHFKCTRKDRDRCLTLVTDSKEAKKVVSEVHFAENSGFLALACRAFSHLSEDVALHYYPSDEENRALMKKLMGLYKSKVILHWFFRAR